MIKQLREVSLREGQLDWGQSRLPKVKLHPRTTVKIHSKFGTVLLTAGLNADN